MLWFKNLMIYRLNPDITLSAELLEKQLAAFVFTPCGSQDTSKMGWTPPAGPRATALTHAAGGQIILCACKEEKILPAPVIKQTLAASIEKREQEQRRRLKKTEKEALKEEVLHTLLPRAFSRFSQTRLWIDSNTHLIMVDAASAKKAEEVLALLRKSLGSLPVVPLTPETPTELTLTKWVRSGELPAGFTLMDEAELKAPREEDGIIRCKKQELLCDEIASHIEAGKLVTRLALEWQSRIALLLNGDGSVKRLKFADTLREQNDDIDREDVAQRFDADFILMTGELAALISDLTAALASEAAH